MNNCEEFNCPSLEVPIGEVKEALRCILYTILFNRAIGGSRPIEPITMKAPLFEVGYMKIESPEVDAQVEDRVKAFSEAAERSKDTQFTLVVGFYSEIPKDPGLWQFFSSKKADKIYFEKWKIGITVTPQTRNDDEGARMSAQQVRSIMWFILRKVAEKMDHLPMTSNTAIYPFEITFEKPKDTAWSPRNFASSIKNIPYIT